MSTLLLAAAVVLTLTTVISLVYILRGLTVTDRLLAIPLLSTATVVLLLIFSEILVLPPLRTISWVVALFTVIMSVMLVKTLPS